MFKRFFPFFLIFGAITFTAYSCKKDDIEMPQPEAESNSNSTVDSSSTSNPTYDYIPIDSANSIHCFQVGSYWIYRNDSTGVEDSVYVSQVIEHDTIHWYVTGGFNEPSYRTDDYQLHDMRLTSTLSGKTLLLAARSNHVLFCTITDLSYGFFDGDHIDPETIRPYSFSRPDSTYTLYGETFSNAQIGYHNNAASKLCNLL